MYHEEMNNFQIRQFELFESSINKIIEILGVAKIANRQ